MIFFFKLVIKAKRLEKENVRPNFILTANAVQKIQI